MKQVGEATKVLIVDDHPAFIEGLSVVLHSIIPSVRVLSALTGAEAFDLLAQHVDIDYVLLDLHLPDQSGLDMISRFRDDKLLTHIVVITSESRLDMIDQALASHVSGFLTKDFDRNILAECFDTIEKGDVFMVPELALQLKHYRESSSVEKHTIESQLSKRQEQALLLIAKGYSNQEIATVLGISESTVKTHVSSLIALFEADNRTHCVAEARRLGVISGWMLRNSEKRSWTG